MSFDSCLFIFPVTVNDTHAQKTTDMKHLEPEITSPRATPTRTGRTSPSVVKTLPRKLSTPFEEKKPKAQPKYGGFGGFGLSYSSAPKSPMTSPDRLQSTPTPDSFGKSPEPSNKINSQISPEPKKEKDTTQTTNTSTSISTNTSSTTTKEDNKSSVSSSSKTEETKTSSGADSWRERLKEKKRLRELEREKEELERQQRAKEREQRAKEREQKYNEQVKNIKEDATATRKSSYPSTTSSKPGVSVSPVPAAPSSTPSSPTKKVSNRFTPKEEETSKKAAQKYGGFSGFGVSYSSTTKTKSPSPIPDSPKTQTQGLEKPQEPEIKTTTAIESSRTKETVRDEKSPKDSETNKTKVVIAGEDDMSSSSSSSLSSNSSSSFTPRGSSSTFNRQSQGRKSDAGVNYYSTNKTNTSTGTRDRLNVDKVTETNRNNLLKIDKEDTSPGVLSRSDGRWNEESVKEARQEKERLRKEIEEQEERTKRTSPSPITDKVPMRRRFNSKGAAIGAFYRRRSRMIDSEESSESKSPTPFQQRSSTSPGPPRSPSPRPSSPRANTNLSSESSTSVSTSDSLSPSTNIRQNVKTSPKTLAPPQHPHSRSSTQLEESNVEQSPRQTSPSKPPLSPSKIEAIPEEKREVTPTPPQESPMAIHTWKTAPQQQQKQPEPELPPSQQQEENRPRTNTASSNVNRIAQQKMKMLALMEDETLIESTKVEVNKIQQKKEVRLIKVHV